LKFQAVAYRMTKVFGDYCLPVVQMTEMKSYWPVSYRHAVKNVWWIKWQLDNTDLSGKWPLKQCVCVCIL